MKQQSVPFIFMRGGSSRGPYFNRKDLPQDLDELSKFLIAALGSGHPLNIDGIGGGNAVTTKVAMLSKSTDEWADVDYFFAQISVEDCLVDYAPTCGNIMTGVAPAAIEMGLVNAVNGITTVNILAVNTGARIVARVHTPKGEVTYHGNTRIDGVPGTAAPIELSFQGVAGSSTGNFLPTGNTTDLIDGIAVTCMDVAMPMVIAKARDLGLTGYESQTELDANSAFFSSMESVRLKAAKLMGMGDCSQSVTPKFGVLARAQNGGTIAARYFMPWSAHPTMAVTGSQCLAACALTPGTVASELLSLVPAVKGPVTVILEHPMGNMDVNVDYEINAGAFTHHSAGMTRTARKLAAGTLFVDI